MRRANRVSSEGSWPLLVGSTDEATSFIEPPAPANDMDFAPPQSTFERARLADVVRATASRAMTETLLSFALYGAALYPYFGDPSWILDREDPDGPMEFTSLASDPWQARAARREEWSAAEPSRWTPAPSAGGRRAGRSWSLLARLRKWVVGSAWAGD
jgi:hypothetical protein